MLSEFSDSGEALKSCLRLMKERQEGGRNEQPRGVIYLRRDYPCTPGLSSYSAWGGVRDRSSHASTAGKKRELEVLGFIQPL